MNPGEKLFRKAALEKIASPERLDELMRVTAPSGWLSLLALGLVIVAAVLWSLFGSISIKVQGQGILIRGAAVLDVTSGTSGRLTDIQVAVGDGIAAGQVIASVEQEDLRLRIENTQDELRRLRGQQGQQQASTSGILSQLRAQRRDLEAKLAQQRDLVERGLITRSTMMATQSQIASIDQQIARERQQTSSGGNQVAALEDELEELESKLASASEVVSPYDGRVLELMVDPGNLVTPGTRLLTLEPLEGPIDAVLFVPAANGKKVRPGMETRVSPSTYKSEEYGFIVGEVRRAASFPATPEGMLRVLRNQELATTLAGEGPKIEIVAQLTEDETVSGFEWTSAGGPPGPVYSGTLCEANIVVEKKKPISYVLPIFRQALAME